MDSKQLFRFFHSKFYLSNWLNEDGDLAQSEVDVKWHYCGVNEDFRTEFVSQTINDTFTDDEIYLCISSGNSSLVHKSAVVDQIGKMLHKKEIGIMDQSFTKMIFFNSYGTFKIGIIRDFPESRPKPDGNLLKVAFHANSVDQSTYHVSEAVTKHFESFEKALHKDYGGNMEQLWIDLELVESHKSYPFRFQKRIGNPSSYTEFYSYNVGHYSVRPDFEKLRTLVSEEEICSYVFELLYQSTQILLDKQKKLDGFDASKFRLDFQNALKKTGYV